MLLCRDVWAWRSDGPAPNHGADLTCASRHVATGPRTTRACALWTCVVTLTIAATSVVLENSYL
jgi:hypothetical protein